MTRITPHADGGEVGERVDLTALPIGTRLRTRGGGRARLLANDLLDDTHPCAVAINEDGSEYIETMTAAGQRLNEDEWHINDIVGVARPTHSVRVKLYRKGDGSIATLASTDPDALLLNVLKNDLSLIADAIVEIEELAPTTPAPVGDARGEG